MKLGTLDIKKAYLGTFQLTHNNAFVQEEPLIEQTVDDRLRFEAVENSTFGLSKLASVSSVQYSLDNGNTWTELTTNDNVSLNAGETAYLRGKITGNLSTSNYTQFIMTGKIAAKGNIMYLYDYETLPVTITYTYTFNYLFRQCDALISAPELPATTLANSCYYCMFRGCTSLTSAPELPATTLANSCYYYMFHSCTSLTSAPELPVTTLANSCYYGMFQGCTSLTSAPELPATTLAGSCYYGMFNGCTSLISAPELPATTLADSCYSYMFRGCSSLNYIKCLATYISASYCVYNWVYGVAASGTFVKNPNTTWPSGTSGIPDNWTVS